jgi:hypothetical protein
MGVLMPNKAAASSANRLPRNAGRCKELIMVHTLSLHGTL